MKRLIFVLIIITYTITSYSQFKAIKGVLFPDGKVQNMAIGAGGDPDYVIRKIGTKIYSFPNPNTSYVAYSDTNLTSVLQRSMNQLVNGGIIHINKGLYNFIDSLNIPYNHITIEGDGMYETILKLRPWFDYTPTTGDRTRSMIWLRHSDYFTLKGVQLDGNADNQHYQWESSNSVAKIMGIMGSWWTSGHTNWDDPDYVTVRNCYIHDFTQYGIDINMSKYSIVEDCYFRDNRENNFNYSDSVRHSKINRVTCEGAGSVSIAITGYDNEVTNCIVRASTNWTPTWGLEFIRTAHRCKFANNYVIGTKTPGTGIGHEMRAGFGASGGLGIKDCVITGNQFYDVSGASSKGITFQNDTGSLVSNNIITGVTGYGIQVQGGYKTAILNNVIRSTQGTGAGISLQDNDAATIHCSSVLVKGNYVEMYGYGIMMQALASNCLVLDNVFKSLSYGDYNIESTVTGTVWNNNYSTYTNSFIFPSNIPMAPSYKTVKYLIGYPGATGTDFNWTSAANTTQQNLDLGYAVPSNARVVAIEIKCTQSVAGGITGFTIGAGNASAGSQYIAPANCNTANWIIDIIDATKPAAVSMTASAATHIWLAGVPTGANWSTMTAGKWSVYITYLFVK
jgi:hypothetical protein